MTYRDRNPSRHRLNASKRAGRCQLTVCLRPQDRADIINALRDYAIRGPMVGRPSEKAMAKLEAWELVRKVTASTFEDVFAPTPRSLTLKGFDWGTIRHVLATTARRAELAGNDALYERLLRLFRWVRMRQDAHPVIGPWLKLERAIKQAEDDLAEAIRRAEATKRAAEAELARLQAAGGIR